MTAVTQSRQRDRMHLLWLKLRCHGWTTKRIAKVFGLKEDVVRRTTNLIRTADAAFSGEDVAAYYKFVKRGRAKNKIRPSVTKNEVKE